MSDSSSGPGPRVWAQLSPPDRALLESDLPPADLQTLLISVARERARQVTPARVLQRWRDNRFVRPSDRDPRILSAVESVCWQLLPDSFVGVDLSPVAPLGTCSAVAPVDQNRVVSTVRGTEVVSDPTNVLAVEAAARRRRGVQGRIDLAARHRVLRAQRFEGPGLFAHFNLFALVSSTRDRGSGMADADMLLDHLAVWRHVLDSLVTDLPARLTVTVFDSPVMRERLHDRVRPAFDAMPGSAALVEDEARTHGRGYYRDLALGIRVDAPDGEIDLGDGGSTDWTAALLADAKERCLVSCISVERLASIATLPPAHS